ncbi:EI24 domain-containing protein [Desulfotalea psychrophila]|uniref:Cysteine biosynthesis protein n=1 Tax=Desulfotalea psychrophila (strain LSv54 / DSM 12343) TaxID=177439 RepID=Q6AQC6_DESPS|nr:EI24 domain-containing protein [Desulfotalea psychrophila]CAG35447.1 unknown protein [Desulfotalea psychrophila LSv54]
MGKNFFTSGQSSLAWWQIIKDYFFGALRWLYLIGTRIICFYLSFLIAYTLTSPGYFFLSHAAEKIYAGSHFDPDAAFTLKGSLRDLWEGAKIALLGVVVTLVAFSLNFIPLLGQALVILLYTFYSTLIFIDYPASRRQWSLGRKFSWLRNNPFISLRLGIFPALISLVPVINIFGMAFLFPLMTVHATLNFVAIEISPQKKA